MQFSNQGSGNILVSLFLETHSHGTPAEICIFKNQPLYGFQHRDVYNESLLYLRPKDSLYAVTDGENSVSNIIISYRELTELTE